MTRGHENENIEFEIKFRMKILEKERLVTYLLIIGLDENSIIVKREILRYKRREYGSPFHFLDFKHGQGYAILNEEAFDKTDKELKPEKQTLDSNDILAIKELGQFQRFKAASAFRLLIENWHVSDFHINDARGSKDTGYAEHLSTTGDNLPLVAQYLYEKHPNIFNTVLDKMKQRVPGISKIEAKNTEDSRLFCVLKIVLLKIHLLIDMFQMAQLKCLLIWYCYTILILFYVWKNQRINYIRHY